MESATDGSRSDWSKVPTIIGDAGAMGGKDSAEFFAIAPIGEDTMCTLMSRTMPPTLKWQPICIHQRNPTLLKRIWTKWLLGMLRPLMMLLLS